MSDTTGDAIRTKAGNIIIFTSFYLTHYFYNMNYGTVTAEHLQQFKQIVGEQYVFADEETLA